nr:MAG TPA: helix-turn-helix domain protein [Caudoviricetes sp.]
MARKAYVIDGKAIDHWLIDEGMTRKQLAEEAGISGSTLRHAINDGRNCGIDILLNLSLAMDVRPWDLVREMGPVGGNR